jgi:hypothetical protein
MSPLGPTPALCESNPIQRDRRWSTSPQALLPFLHTLTMHFASSLRFLLLALPLSMSTLSASATLSEDQTPLVSQEQPLTRAQPSLADLLTIDGSLSIFFSYARELELSSRLDDLREHTTILAPKNKAILALARKPCVESNSFHEFSTYTRSLQT